MQTQHRPPPIEHSRSEPLSGAELELAYLRHELQQAHQECSTLAQDIRRRDRLIAQLTWDNDNLETDLERLQQQRRNGGAV